VLSNRRGFEGTHGLSLMILLAAITLACAHVGAKVQQLHVAIASLRRHSIKH
jgi:hypothetical protein